MRKTILSFFALALIANALFGGYGKPLHIVKATKAPKIDGVSDASDPWTSTWVKMTAAKVGNTTTTMSAQFQLAFDDVNLYLICRQTGNMEVDTSAIDIPNSYERDNFEVFIKMDTSSAPDGKYENNGTYHFRMQRASVFPDLFDFPSTGNWKAYVGHGLQIKQVESGTSFTQEWQIPRTALADSGCVNWSHQMFKFEIAASDNTTGKADGITQKLFWQDASDNESIDTRTFSLVILAIFAKKSTFIENGNLLSINDCGILIAEKPTLENISIFPNPVEDMLNITAENELKNIVIKNILGKEVLRINARNNNTISFPMLKIPAGIYFISLTDKSGNITTSKIVKR
jgi:hypothetical protein